MENMGFICMALGLIFIGIGLYKDIRDKKTARHYALPHPAEKNNNTKDPLENSIQKMDLQEVTFLTRNASLGEYKNALSYARDLWKKIREQQSFYEDLTPDDLEELDERARKKMQEIIVMEEKMASIVVYTHRK